MSSIIVKDLKKSLKLGALNSPQWSIHQSRQQNKTPQKSQIKPAAVLIALVDLPEGVHILITQRASHLKHHPGQNCLPGGKWMDQDKSLLETAKREAFEEIGLPSEQLEVLGSFEGHETTSGFYITPFVAISHYQGSWKLDKNEVKTLFHFPLSWALDAQKWRIESAIWEQKNRQYRACWWSQHLIWGATAEIFRNLRQHLKSESKLTP